MPKVWIAQCLCPQRHAILAAARECEGAGEAAILRDELRDQVGEFVTDGILNPRCGLCHAPQTDWSFDLQETAWVSLAEATPALRDLEAANIATGIVLGELRPAKTKH